MYLPRLFREDDPAVLHEVMREHGFAALVTTRDNGPFVSHLPFLYEPSADAASSDPATGGHGVLKAHMARANPHWKDFDPAREVLVVFQGPHAYVSPSWYEGALHVPTWNYVAVHAYGVPRIIEDHDELYRLLEVLVDTHEAGFERPWRFALPDDFVRDLMRSIVGFEIRITRLEGKLKLSQNREPEDQRRVREALGSSPDPAIQALARWMARVEGRE
jgi:transcriptional regulator